MAETTQTKIEPPVNVIKCRDDPHPIAFEADASGDNPSASYVLTGRAACSWAKAGEAFGRERLRQRIEPWLTALCQSDHLSVLIGSGLTTAVHMLATDKMPAGMDKAEFGEFTDLINAEANRSAVSTGRATANIEDQLRVCLELLRGLEILDTGDADAKAKTDALRKQLNKVLGSFANSIREGEESLRNASDEKREEAFNYLVSFLMSFASRTGTRERLHIFTSNYDRIIEAGADLAGLHLLDRFVGSLAPLFRSSRLNLDLHYNPPGIRGEPRYLEGVARLTKLHGSIDWMHCEGNIRRIGVPFGPKSLDAYLDPSATGTADATQMMIYPNAAKDRETAAYPFVELFRDFAAAICRPNHTLITYGYSFGDDHFNRVIEDMLTIPSTHLVVIAYDDPGGRILRTYERLGRHAQVSLLIGPELADLKTLVDHYLPKPAIDRATFRMSELLKSRWGTRQTTEANSESVQGDAGGPA